MQATVPAGDSELEVITAPILSAFHFVNSKVDKERVGKVAHLICELLLCLGCRQAEETVVMGGLLWY